MSTRQHQFHIEMHKIDAFETEPDNADRAEFVAPLVHAFATAYYWGNEEIETIVQDLIADLGHFLDRYESEGWPRVFRSDTYKRGSGDGMEIDDAFYGLVMDAWHCYDEEVDLEVAEEGEDETSVGVARLIEPGQSAKVIFPPRKTMIDARLLRVEPNGDLTFVHPRNGSLRTVHPDQVGQIHRRRNDTPS